MLKWEKPKLKVYNETSSKEETFATILSTCSTGSLAGDDGSSNMTVSCVNYACSYCFSA